MLPKFLIGDNSQEQPDKIFVIHTQNPRFIIESDNDDFNVNQLIYWIDNEPDDPYMIEKMVEQAEIFFEDELFNQEELYDNDFED